MKSSFQFMQVINLTPDSFSDGGKYDSHDGVKRRIEEAIAWNTHYLDFGACSTASMNKPVDESLELQRFEQCFLPVLKNKIIPENLIISIDTFRPKVFFQVYLWIKKYLPNNLVLFNDVSGVIDQELIDFLKKYPDFKYVYSHTNVRTRECTNDHMLNPLDCSKENVIEVVRQYFKDATGYFNELSLLDRVIFDPAFGFSKKMEQNLELIRSLGPLIQDFSQTWLLGISRKSFFKKSVNLDSLEVGPATQIEYLHAAAISRWMNQLSGKNIIIRGHDPSVFWAAVQMNSKDCLAL